MVLLAQMQPNFAVKTLHTKLPNLVKVFDDKISAGPKLFNLFLLQRKLLKIKLTWLRSILFHNWNVFAIAPSIGRTVKNAVVLTNDPPHVILDTILKGQSAFHHGVDDVLVQVAIRIGFESHDSFSLRTYFHFLLWQFFHKWRRRSISVTDTSIWPRYWPRRFI